MKTLFSFQGDGIRLQLYVKNDIFYVSKNRKILLSCDLFDDAKRYFYGVVRNHLFQGDIFRN